MVVFSRSSRNVGTPLVTATPLSQRAENVLRQRKRQNLRVSIHIERSKSFRFAYGSVSVGCGRLQSFYIAEMKIYPWYMHVLGTRAVSCSFLL